MLVLVISERACFFFVCFFLDAYVHTCLHVGRFERVHKNLCKSITEYLKVMRHEQADQRKACRPHTFKKKKRRAQTIIWKWSPPLNDL